jgi:hypothetical protein
MAATGNPVADLQTVLAAIHQLRVTVDALKQSIPDAINAAGGVLTPQAQQWFTSAKASLIRNAMGIVYPLETLSSSRNDTIREIALEMERILITIVDESTAMTTADFRQRVRILDGKVADLEDKARAIRRPMNAGKRRKTRKGRGKKRLTRRR